MGTSEAESRYDALIDRAESALEAEDFDQALEHAAEAIELDPGEAEGYFLAGVALFEVGEHRRARDYLIQASERAPGDPMIQTYEGATRFMLGEEGEAEKLLRTAVQTDADLPEAHYWLSMVVERAGKLSEADGHLATCARLAPEHFHAPYRMSRKELARDLETVIQDLPPMIANAIREVPIIIEDLPSPALIRGEEHLAPDILGLFVGTSLAEGSVFNPTIEPNAVYLFKRNLERMASTREELLEEARITLIHEIGHYLGLDEDELHDRGLD